MIRAIPWILGGAAIVFMVLFCAGLDVSVKVLLYAAAGWAFFLNRVLPVVTVNWLYIFEAVIALAAFAVGVHWFAAWLYRETVAATAQHSGSVTQQNGPRPQAWRVRWSISIVAVVIAMFIAGISMVGMSHNVVWLFTDRGPIIEGGGSGKQ
jgi:hypothetical protein